MTTSRARLSVFLSSTAADLGEYREQASSVIDTLGYRCIKMETFGAAGETPEQYCTRRVEECDVFVGLLGPCYGSSPAGKEMSFTEMEFDVAQARGKPCLMFMTQDDFPLPARLFRNCNWEKQQRFRDKVNKALVRGVFANKEQLSVQLVAALQELPSGSLPEADCAILCGGSARRLWPLTQGLSKVLLPVAGRPVLDYLLRFVRDCRSIKRTYLLCSNQYAEQIQGFLNELRDSTVELVIEPNAADGGRLGPIGALNYLIDQRSPQHLVVLGGDNLFQFKLSDLVLFAHQKAASANAFYRLETGCDVSEYGVATLHPDGSVAEFKEKELIPAYLNISTACYFLREAEVKRVRGYLSNGNDPMSLGSYVHWLINQGVPVAGRVFTNPWFDIGTRRKLLEANRHFLIDHRGGTLVGPTEIKGPVQIERGAVIRNSTVGPNVYVGAGAEIVDSTVRDCIIMEQARVRGSFVSDSVVGARSTVEGMLQEAIVGREAFYLAEAAPPAKP